MFISCDLSFRSVVIDLSTHARSACIILVDSMEWDSFVLLVSLFYFWVLDLLGSVLWLHSTQWVFRLQFKSFSCWKLEMKLVYHRWNPSLSGVTLMSNAGLIFTARKLDKLLSRTPLIDIIHLNAFVSRVFIYIFNEYCIYLWYVCEYCIRRYLYLDRQLLSRLQSVLNATARLVFSARKLDHVSPLLHELHCMDAGPGADSVPVMRFGAPMPSQHQPDISRRRSQTRWSWRRRTVQHSATVYSQWLHREREMACFPQS